MQAYRITSVVFFFLIVLSLVTLFPKAVKADPWRVWSKTPVFDGGRTMPLSSFAQQIVKDVCGTPRPLIVPDDTVLAELTRVIESRPAPKKDPAEQSIRRESFLPRQDDDVIGINTQFDFATTLMHQQQEQATLKIRNLDRDQAERILQRINTLLPSAGRRFAASELLLSWFAEPEIWNYIPIFDASERDYRSNVLNIPERNLSRYTLKRVAIFQLDHSQGYKRRLAEIHLRRQHSDRPEDLNDFNRITERIDRARTIFEDLTFDPRRHYPSRMVERLHKAGSIDDLSRQQSSSFASGFEAWTYLLNLGDDPAQTATRTLDLGGSEQRVHPATERWHAISHRITQLTGAFDHKDDQGDVKIPSLSAVETQFESLIQAVDINLDDAAVLMRRVYPGVEFAGAMRIRTNTVAGGEAISAENILPKLFSNENIKADETAIRQLVLRYYYSLKTLRLEIESAYIALYDNGRTLRLAPLISKLAVGGPESSMEVQPWASTYLLLRGGDLAVRRFLDPDFPDSQPSSSFKTVKTPTPQKEDLEKIIPGMLSSSMMMRPETTASETQVGETIAESQSAGSATGEDEETVDNISETTAKNPLDRYEVELFGREDFWIDPMTSASSQTPGQLDPIRRVRSDFQKLYSVYGLPGLERFQAELSDRSNVFQRSLRNAAERSEAMQRSLVAQDIENPFIREIVEKTAYPAERALNMEYRYFRLSPFFWMFVFAAASIVFVLIALFIGVFRRDMIDISVDPTTGDEHSSFNKSAIIPERDELDVQDKVSWRNEMRRPDFTNSTEEYMLWIGLLLLGISVLVTFFGGAMRAWISGWAPVTNMYETIVFLAFSASLLGLWYSLYPILYPAFSLAWRYADFPSPGDWSKIFQRRAKNSEAEIEEREDSGVYSMKQAAEDFGVIGNLPGSGIYRGTRSGIYSPARSGIYPGAGLDADKDNPDMLVDSFTNPLAEQQEKSEQQTIFWQTSLAVPRLILMFLTLGCVIRLSYGEYAEDHGLLAAAGQMLAMHDLIDWLVVVLCIALIVWFVPHLILAGLMSIVVLIHPTQVAADLGILSFEQRENMQEKVGPPKPGRSELSSVFQGESLADDSLVDNSGSLWLNLARNRIMNRKLFVLAPAVVAFIAGFVAYYNSAQFNPDIRPLVAVLRSNFWLTVHVVAIIVGYAAALVAWAMAAVALGGAIFGQYRYLDKPSGRRVVQLPAFCDSFVPYILKLLRMALLLLVLGTILGARWADYSWGRFWSWDPKEVWALITILFFCVVLHGRIARYYGVLGTMVGALLGSIAIIMTWYGINFAMKGSIHSYGSGAAGKTLLILALFGLANLLWGFLALFRYSTVASVVQESHELQTAEDSPETIQSDVR